MCARGGRGGGSCSGGAAGGGENGKVRSRTTSVRVTSLRVSALEFAGLCSPNTDLHTCMLMNEDIYTEQYRLEQVLLSCVCLLKRSYL